MAHWKEKERADMQRAYIKKGMIHAKGQHARAYMQKGLMPTCVHPRGAAGPPPPVFLPPPMPLPVFLAFITVTGSDFSTMGASCQLQKGGGSEMGGQQDNTI